MGLAASDFEHYSFRCCFGGFIRYTGMAIAKEKEKWETVSYKEYINTAFLHCNCDLDDSSLLGESLLFYDCGCWRGFSPTYLYCYGYTVIYIVGTKRARRVFGDVVWEVCLSF